MSNELPEKPDFNKMADAFLDQYTKDYPPGKQKCFRSGCEAIWNDYYLPAQKRIKELESKLYLTSKDPTSSPETSAP